MWFRPSPTLLRKGSMATTPLILPSPPPSGPPCPVCEFPSSAPFRVVDDVEYFECLDCGSIVAAPDVLKAVEEGRFPRNYDERYWANEDRSAWQRSHGASLARVAEVFLYARRPIRRFLDIGSGPGYLLDALSTYLPGSKNLFWGVELFPPERHTAHPNFRHCGVGDLEGRFDAGLCMEVVEHMTPGQVRRLAQDLAKVSEPDAIYLINTGMPPYVKSSDPKYLDPYRRGHVVSYSLKGLQALFVPAGFVVRPLRGKDWACVVEYRPTVTGQDLVDERIWTPEPSNVRALKDPTMGEVLYVLGLDAARAYQ